MGRIPLHDVAEQNASIRTELDAAISRVLDSGQFIASSEVSQFETSFSEYIGTEHCIAVGNATDGFEIAFQALGLEPDSEVIIPANAHVSPALAALKVGLKPVFCDVDEKRMLLNSDTVRNQISAKTKVLVAVHLYGRVCPMDELKKLCNENGLILVEDFSQAHGASFNGKKIGSFGDINVCSFYPTKPLGALGDGGAIVMSNKKLADRCRSLANYGWTERNNSELPGRNSRLDELQAAILNVKLNYLDQWNTSRLEKAEMLRNRLLSFSALSVPEFIDGDVCHLFVIQTSDRDRLKDFLLENGIDCQVHYQIPIHKQPLFRQETRFPISEKFCQQVLSLPVNEVVNDVLQSFSQT